MPRRLPPIEEREPVEVGGLDELAPLTIGYEPPNPLFVHGRYGGGVEGALTRVFLFGEPDPNDYLTLRGSGLVTGQEQEGIAARVLQGVEIRVDGRTVAIFSREVIAACSRGHLDIEAVEAMTRSLRMLAEKAPDDLGDAAVTLHQVLAGLVGFPTVGYRIQPSIYIARDSHIEVRGLPLGMRLFLTGYYRREVR